MEKMVYNLRNEVTECQQEQNKFFGDRLKQFITEATGDLSVITSHAAALHQRIRNPPPSLGLPPFPTAIASAPFVVPDLLSDAQKLLNLHSKPPAPASISAPASAVPNNDLVQEATETPIPPAAPTASDSCVRNEASGEVDLGLTEKKDKRRGKRGKKHTAGNDSVCEKTQTKKVSKKSSIESGSSGFHTPLSSSPSPENNHRSQISKSISHAAPTHSGSARVSAVRTRSMKRSDGVPVASNDVPSAPAPRKLSFVEHDAHDSKTTAKESRRRGKRTSRDFDREGEVSVSHVKCSPQLEVPESFSNSSPSNKPIGSSAVPNQDLQEQSKCSPKPSMCRRLKRRKNLIVESPESSSFSRGKDRSEISPVEATKHHGHNRREVEMIDINTGEDNSAIKWLSKHACRTVNLDEYLDNHGIGVTRPKIEDRRVSSDRMDVEYWEEQGAQKLTDTVDDNEPREHRQRSNILTESQLSGPGKISDLESAKNRDVGVLGEDLTDVNNPTVEQEDFDKIMQELLPSDSQSNKEGLGVPKHVADPDDEPADEEISKNDDASISLDGYQGNDDEHDKTNSRAESDFRADPETSRRGSMENVLDDGTQGTDDEIFESAVSHDFSPGAVRSQNDTPSINSKPDKKSVSFKEHGTFSDAEPLGTLPSSEHPVDSSFQVGRDGNISSAAVDELMKMMSEPIQKKRSLSETVHETQPNVGESNLETREPPCELSAFQPRSRRKVFSSKQSTRLPHTPGARPTASAVARSDPRTFTAGDDAVPTSSNIAPIESQPQGQEEMEIEAGVERTNDASVEITKEIKDQAAAHSPRLKFRKRSGGFASNSPQRSSPKPSVSTREDSVSCKIREILSSAPAVKSEAKRQIERVRAERLASQSASKFIRKLHSNTQNVVPSSGFTYNVSKSGLDFRTGGRHKDVEIDDGPPPLQKQSLQLEPQKDEEPQSRSGSVFALSGGSDPTGVSDSQVDVVDLDDSSSVIKSQQSRPEIENLSVDNVQSTLFPEQSNAVKTEDVPGNATASKRQAGPSFEQCPTEFGAGSAFMNLVTSVTSFLPSASGLVGWNQDNTKNVEKESAEEIAERQRLDAERREAELQARREAFRLQKQKEFEEKQRRAEIKRKELAEEERHREENRRKKEEIRLKKKRDEDEAKKRKKMEEERKREERRQQILLKQKQMRKNLEREKELEVKRIESEKLAKGGTSAMRPGPMFPKSLDQAGQDVGKSQEHTQFQTPRPKTLKSRSEDASNYMITPAKETILEDEAEEVKRRRGKHVPKWAKSNNVMKALENNQTDPDELFSNAPMCNLSDLFGEQRKYRTRSSSGNWAFDRLTAQEKLVYKKVTRGFDKDER